MANALVPELAVSDWKQSKRFYCDVLGFTCQNERPEEGFCYLALGGAELMIDQIGTGRAFDSGHCPSSYPFGGGMSSVSWSMSYQALDTAMILSTFSPT